MNTHKNNNIFNKSLVVLAWLLIALGAIFSIKYYLFNNKYISTNNAQVDQYNTPVSSKESGFIQSIRFKENQYVKEGDTLIILDNEDMKTIKLLTHLVVRAPYNGWVGRKNIQKGQFVKTGQTLVNVVSEEKWITANFRETQIEPLKIGTKVILKVDAFPNVGYEGTISSFSPASGSKFSLLPQDNSTGNYVKIEQRIPVRIEFDPNQNTEKLRGGMSIEVNALKH